MDVRSLKDFLRNKGKPYAPVMESFIQFLIVISLVGFSFETLPQLSLHTKQILHILEVITVLIFTVEFIIRAFLATPSTTYLFSFWGFVDFLAIIPFYLGAGMDLRSVRVFRLLRLFRVVKLARYHYAIRRFSRAFQLMKNERRADSVSHCIKYVDLFSSSGDLLF